MLSVESGRKGEAKCGGSELVIPRCASVVGGWF